MKIAIATITLVAFALTAGCSTVPKGEKARSELQTDADRTLAELKQADPSLASVLDGSEGYAVFPAIGKGGFIVGGGYGRGTLYEDGKMVGYTDMKHGAVGALIGGQSFAELIVFQTQEALSSFKSGNFSFGATANAVALDKGAAAATSFKDGVAVFTRPNKGLMAEASLSGQKFTYVPLSEAGEMPAPAEPEVASERQAPTTESSSPEQ